MQAKMTEDEYKGYLKKFGLREIDAINLVWLKTRVTLSQGNIQTHIARSGSMSPAYTALFRLLFRDLERDHEYSA